MREIVIQNLVITILSKIFTFASFIFIAKFLSETEYGGYIYIMMILSLLPMLQFGSMHGTVILFPRFIVSESENENSLFIYSNYISHFLQFIAFIFLFFIDLGLSKSIILIIGLNFLLFLFSDNCIKYLNALHKFQEANIINGFNQLIRPIAVLILFYFYRSINSIFIAHLIVTILTLFLSIRIVRIKIIKQNIYEFKRILKSIYKIGFFIYLTWTIDIVFRTADRWFISFYYSLEELALYGFTSSLSLNVWLLAMSFFAPYSQLLYRYVAENNFEKAESIIQSTNRKLYVLLTIVSLTAIVFYPFLLQFYVEKYFGSELLFSVLVISSIFLSINNMSIYYMISSNLYLVLLKYQLIVLGINLLLNTVFAFYHLDIISYSYSTLFTLMLYFFLVKRYTNIDIKKKIRSSI